MIVDEMRSRFLALPVLAFAVSLPQSRAQSLDCDADDGQCLSDELRLACRETAATAESCLEWLRREVEPRAIAGDSEWTLTVATGYFLAADLSGSTEEAERLRQQSRSIFQSVLAAWPAGEYALQANQGLVAVARDVHERISYLRNVLRIEPDRVNNMAFLADALVNRGEIGDLQEAAELYRSAYLESGDPPVWSFASNALDLYASTGRMDRADSLKDQVAKDSGIEEFAEEIASGRFAEDLGRAAQILQTACNTYIIAVFGRETCADGVASLVAATRRSSASVADRQSLADVAVEGMRLLRIADDGRYEHDEERRVRYFQLRSILQEWIDTGTDTAAVYVLFAQLPSADLLSDDPNESVSAFERAVELAPDNGLYRYWLALGYLKQGRLDKAIEHLRLARDSLPENLGPTPESVDARIREVEMAMGTAR